MSGDVLRKECVQGSHGPWLAWASEVAQRAGEGTCTWEGSWGFGAVAGQPAGQGGARECAGAARPWLLGVCLGFAWLWLGCAAASKPTGGGRHEWQGGATCSCRRRDWRVRVPGQGSKPLSVPAVKRTKPLSCPASRLLHLSLQPSSLQPGSPQPCLPSWPTRTATRLAWRGERVFRASTALQLRTHTYMLAWSLQLRALQAQCLPPSSARSLTHGSLCALTTHRRCCVQEKRPRTVPIHVSVR